VNPGWGDAVQAAKAGLMEIADVFVVNKADRSGARDAVRELKQMLALSESEWKPEIVATVATKGEGIEELWGAISRHRAYQEEKGLLDARRRRRVEREIKEIVAERFRRRVEHESSELLDRLTDDVVARRTDPYAAADRLVESLREPGTS
jgi:LAO/AO transport system kinase